MKPYKLKHLPTGLYYLPNTGLSKKGKVYQGTANALSYFKDTVTISIDVRKKQFQPFEDYFNKFITLKYSHRPKTYLIPKNHFIKEEL